MDAITGLNRTREPGTNDQIASLARRYCDLIVSAAGSPSTWLKEVAELLPRLHAAIALTEADYAFIDHSDPVDLDARFDLYTRLRRLLGDRDSYWLEFDCASEGAGDMSGSLADDLTDIHCELQRGLRLYELDPEYALAAWLSGYEQHWGQHLVDAERHLAMLGAQSRLAR